MGLDGVKTVFHEKFKYFEAKGHPGSKRISYFLLLLKTSLLRNPWKDLFFNFEPLVSKWTAKNFYLFSP